MFQQVIWHVLSLSQSSLTHVKKCVLSESFHTVFLLLMNILWTIHCFGIVFYLPSISDTLDPPNQNLSLSSLPNLKRPVMNRVSPTVCQLLAYLTAGQNELNFSPESKGLDR